VVVDIAPRDVNDHELKVFKTIYQTIIDQWDVHVGDGLTASERYRSGRGDVMRVCCSGSVRGEILESLSEIGVIPMQPNAGERLGFGCDTAQVGPRGLAPAILSVCRVNCRPVNGCRQKNKALAAA
jgi:hypothetical protein